MNTVPPALTLWTTAIKLGQASIVDPSVKHIIYQYQFTKNTLKKKNHQQTSSQEISKKIHSVVDENKSYKLI